MGGRGTSGNPAHRRQAGKPAAEQTSIEQTSTEQAGTGHKQTDAEVETRIRDAYQNLTQRPQEWITLTILRAQLTDLPRDQVDDALKRLTLQGSRDVHLAPEADQKALTQADRDAALYFGGKDQHIIAIDPTH